MKKIIILLMCFCTLIPADSYAKGGKFWKGFKRVLGRVTEAALPTLVNSTLESCGYTKEDAKRNTRDIFQAISGDSENIQRGLDYLDAEDKYARQNIIKDYVFDFAADISENPNVINTVRQMADAKFSYMSDIASTDDKNIRNLEYDTLLRKYACIMYDTYYEAKERQSKYLAERLNLKRKLIARGYDSEIANEIAGQMIIIRKDETLTEDEKQRYYRSFGLNENADSICEIIDDVTSESYVHIDVEEENRRLTQQQEEERLRKEAEERRLREIEEKKQAIAKVNSFTINNFIFDQSTLPDNQVAQLDEIVDILNKYDSLNIKLTGHTCKKGYKSVNNRIGLRRAEAVKSYMNEKGVDGSRVITDSKGELEPLIKYPSLDERKQNRRVTFEIINQ